MKKIILVLSVIGLIIISCKKETPRDETIQKKVIKQKEQIYRVSINAVFINDGHIGINYVDNRMLKFNSDEYFVIQVKGNDLAQEIVFELPKNFYLEKFRLRPEYDNKHISKLHVNQIEVSFNDNSILITPENIVKYIKPNQFVMITPNNPVINFSKKTINKEVIFDPFLISTELLSEELINL